MAALDPEQASALRERGITRRFRKGQALLAVSKALQTLRKVNWVITERRRITVVDLDALRRRSA